MFKLIGEVIGATVKVVTEVPMDILEGVKEGYEKGLFNEPEKDRPIEEPKIYTKEEIDNMKKD
jgi:hypothetical protein